MMDIHCGRQWVDFVDAVVEPTGQGHMSTALPTYIGAMLIVNKQYKKGEERLNECDLVKTVRNEVKSLST